MKTSLLTLLGILCSIAAISQTTPWDITTSGQITYTAGKVGIGTNSPSQTLTVDGDVNIGGEGNHILRVRHINGKSHLNSSYGDLYLNYHNTHPVYVGVSANKSNLYVYGSIRSNFDASRFLTFNPSGDGNYYLNYVGGSTTSRLGFQIDGASKMSIMNDGDVGIGTNSPDEKLDVNGSVLIQNNGEALKIGTSAYSDKYIQIRPNSIYGVRFGLRTTSFSNTDGIALVQTGGNKGFGVKVNDNNSWNTISDLDFFINKHSNVGIGTTTPDMKLTVAGHLNVGGVSNGTIKARHLTGKSHTSADYGDLYLQYHTTHPVRIGTGTNPAPLYAYGKVGIGTTSPTEKLEVNGTIRSKEVKVEASGWPDYVFEESYELWTLEETEAFIKENKHLPEIPSAEEIEANGVQLGEMNRLLLQKIEELTLSMIKMNKLHKKEIEELRSQIHKLKSK
ncbi:MAG: hypothetical protein AAF391_09385 [Bacteroidota bacterium]